MTLSNVNLIKLQWKKTKLQLYWVIKKQIKHKAKWNKYIKDLNNTINNLDVMEIRTTLYPAAAECTLLFSIIYRMFTNIDHVLGQKASLSKFQRMFSDRKPIKLKKWWKDNLKIPTNEAIKNILVSNPWARENSHWKLENILNW